MPSPDAHMRCFQYRFRFRCDWPLQHGGTDALGGADALRRLRMKFLTAHLPDGLELRDPADARSGIKTKKSRKIIGLLIDLQQHRKWLAGIGGARADFSLRNLRGLKLPRLALSMADMSGCDLSESDLTGSDLRGANLAGANLARTNLTNVDLTGADLSDANLSHADLTGAQLDGADVWRANFHGSTISLWDLHNVTRCGHPGSNLLVAVPA